MATDIIPKVHAPAELRQVARDLRFSKDAIPYINWNAIGEQRAQLGCGMAVETTPDGGLVVLLYWRYDVAPGENLETAIEACRALIYPDAISPAGADPVQRAIDLARVALGVDKAVQS